MNDTIKKPYYECPACSYKINEEDWAEVMRNEELSYLCPGTTPSTPTDDECIEGNCELKLINYIRID